MQTNSKPFDIAELRANIGSDADVERSLLHSFYESTQESLQLLASCMDMPDDAYNALWKTHMHQIKGAALNICAGGLMAASKQAQDEYSSPRERKRVLLDNVRSELALVKTYIDIITG